MTRKMNKRGDVPVTILVLGVVAVCIMAILSFYISLINVKEGFDVGAVKEAALVKDQAELYEGLGYNQQEINEILGIIDDGDERYYFIKYRGISVKYNLPR